MQSPSAIQILTIKRKWVRLPAQSHTHSLQHDTKSKPVNLGFSSFLLQVGKPCSWILFLEEYKYHLFLQFVRGVHIALAKQPNRYKGKSQAYLRTAEALPDSLKYSPEQFLCSWYKHKHGHQAGVLTNELQAEDAPSQLLQKIFNVAKFTTSLVRHPHPFSLHPHLSSNGELRTDE